MRAEVLESIFSKTFATQPIPKDLPEPQWRGTKTEDVTGINPRHLTQRRSPIFHIFDNVFAPENNTMSEQLMFTLIV